MLKSGNRSDRHHHAAGVLINGTLAHASKASQDIPGPGHYNVYATIDPIVKNTNGIFDLNTSRNMSMSSGGNMRSKSSRMLSPSASIKDGMLFLGKTDDHSHVGPGHYHHDRDPLIKRSFNSRVNSPRSPRSPNRHQQENYSNHSNSNYTPSHSANYGGMISPRYSSRDDARDDGESHLQYMQQQQFQQQGGSPVQYIHGGELNESHFYDDHHDQDRGNSNSNGNGNGNGGTPVISQQPNFKKGRKPGRMSVMESMIPSMFKPKKHS